MNEQTFKVWLLNESDIKINLIAGRLNVFVMMTHTYIFIHKTFMVKKHISIRVWPQIGWNEDWHPRRIYRHSPLVVWATFHCIFYSIDQIKPPNTIDMCVQKYIYIWSSISVFEFQSIWTSQSKTDIVCLRFIQHIFNIHFKKKITTKGRWIWMVKNAFQFSNATSQ